MLQVEKKKRRGMRRWIPWAVILLIAAMSTVFALRALWKEPVPEIVDTRGSITNRENAEISWIRIQMKGREAWTAERNEAGEMVLAEGADWSMDELLGEQLMDALANVVYEDILTEDPADYQDRLAEFGLEEPTLIAEVRYTDGTEMTLRIGNDSGMEDEDFRFMTIDGDPRLYAVAGSLMEDLAVEEELLHPVTQPEIQTARLDRITVRDGDGNIQAEWSLAGSITDADAAANWMVTFPVTYPVDQDQMSNLKKNAGNLRLGLYVGEATEENLREYGLDHPQYRLEIHMAAGSTGQITEEGTYNVRDWEAETIAFLIGQERNEMTFYCLYGDVIYTMNRFTVESITAVDPMDTLARYPITVETANLSSLEVIHEDGAVDLYELTYTSVPAENEGEENQTVITCRKNGEEMDYSVFEAGYERWLVVNVSGRLPEGWEKRETREKITMKTLSGTEHTVELSDFDAMHDAVTVDGWTLFYLIKGGMGEMP